MLVRRETPEDKTRGGLFLPDTAQKKSQLAKVVAVGNGHVRDDGKLTPLKVERA